MHGSESDRDTADLCRRCADGDEEAFGEVYRRYGGKLYGAAWRILRNPQEAEEIVQEAFLTLYQKAGDNPPRSLGAWLHRVAVNSSLDRIRRRTRRAEVELNEDVYAGGTVPVGETTRAGIGGTANDATHPAAAGTAEYGFGLDIERAVDQLPERARMVFILHDVEGFKHREIGAMMGISDGSSKSQLFRARAMLRDWLQPGAEQ